VHGSDTVFSDANFNGGHRIFHHRHFIEEILRFFAESFAELFLQHCRNIVAKIPEASIAGPW